MKIRDYVKAVFPLMTPGLWLYASVDVAPAADGWGNAALGIGLLFVVFFVLLGALFWVIDVSLAIGNRIAGFERRWGGD